MSEAMGVKCVFRRVVKVYRSKRGVGTSSIRANETYGLAVVRMAITVRKKLMAGKDRKRESADNTKREAEAETETKERVMQLCSGS